MLNWWQSHDLWHWYFSYTLPCPTFTSTYLPLKKKVLLSMCNSEKNTISEVTRSHFVLAPTQQLRADHSKSQQDGEQLLIGQKGDIQLRGHVLGGVAALYRPPFNQLLSVNPRINEHIQSYIRSMCVSTANTSSYTCVYIVILNFISLYF